jgi:hypothetical protein
MDAQQPGAHRMERSPPHTRTAAAGAGDAQQAVGSGRHRTRRASRERQKRNASWVDAVCYQPRDSVRKRGRLAGSRASDHQKGWSLVTYCRELLGVESAEQLAQS